MVSDPAGAEPRWQRFAHGLHEVRGLAWRDGWLYVTQRPEVSRLRDADGDGIADVYETVADGWGVSPVHETGWFVGQPDEILRGAERFRDPRWTGRR